MAVGRHCRLPPLRWPQPGGMPGCKRLALRGGIRIDSIARLTRAAALAAVGLAVAASPAAAATLVVDDGGKAECPNARVHVRSRQRSRRRTAGDDDRDLPGHVLRGADQRDAVADDQGRRGGPRADRAGLRVGVPDHRDRHRAVDISGVTSWTGTADVPAGISLRRCRTGAVRASRITDLGDAVSPGISADRRRGRDDAHRGRFADRGLRAARYLGRVGRRRARPRR